MKKGISRNILVIIIALMYVPVMVTAQKNIDSAVYKIIKVKPSKLDQSVRMADDPHIVFYDPKVKNNKILLWLTGTGGTTKHVPELFINTALESGYRVIALSFISEPGVSQVCIGDTLNSDTDCAAEFRRMRIYGTPAFSLIPDKPQDAIVPRLTKLLQSLSKSDLQGGWSAYLKNENPDWNKIAIAGQSQGGGMAEFIAQNNSIDRVISFSGGWDYSDSKEKKIAGWYFNKSKTPVEKWYAAYHIDEVAAKSLIEICTALKIPKDHIFALDKKIDFSLENPNKGNKKNPYHTEGIKNTIYKPVWQTMLGSGKIN
jgi:dienelactone hydrolase